MFAILSFVENINKFIRIKTKVFYWKIKYGNRLRIGKNFHFRKGLIINISKEGKLLIGDNCFFNNYCSINCHKKIQLGNNNIFGENVKIYDHNHIFNNKKVDKANSYTKSAITVGNNNWFASNTTILSKAVIGNNNVFGVNTVINDNYKNDLIVKNKGINQISTIIYR